MKKLIEPILPLADWLLFLLVFPAGFLLRLIRTAGTHRMPMCRRALRIVGVFPIRRHYYDPLFDFNQLKYPLDHDRALPGIDWNLPEQLSLLANLHYREELCHTPTEEVDRKTYYFNNGFFESGDAEFWYNLIRYKKPKRIIEIGCGNSTRMAVQALQKNREENPQADCLHICIEPYEAPWLEELGVKVIRSKVEEVAISVFAQLEENDILFIDSSHMIKPQGDVLFEYLQLLPTLNEGVIVHIHDIFSPRDYLRQWLHEQVRLWNEQYLVEAFLTCNHNWKIIGALNYLQKNHYAAFKEHFPFVTTESEPTSFYIQKCKATPIPPSGIHLDNGIETRALACSEA
jgi:hypothetical protein